MPNEKIVFGEIRVKRGLKANLPILKPGEPAFCTDTGEYFIGTEDGTNMLLNGGGAGGGSIPSNVILFEDWNAGESVTIDTGNTAPPADITAPILTITSGGAFTGTKSITMSTNETSNIYYTIDGSTPTTSSSKYTAPINISSTTTIKAFAVDTAGNQSSIQTITYTLDTSGQTPSDTTPPVLTITPASTFTDSQTVTMNANEASDIWYTIDGSDPVSSGTRTKYSSTLTLSATTTIKAYAIDTSGNVSAVQTVTYTKQTAGSFANITDSFNRVDSLDLGSTETGQIWSQHPDVKYGIRGNKAYQSQQIQGGTPRYRKVPTITVPSNSFAVEVTFSTLDGTSGNESVHIRWVNATSTVMVFRNTGKYNIAKFGSGGFLNLKSGTKIPANGDRIRIEHKSDGTINLYVNGILDATAIDTEYLSTSHKVGFGAETNISEFDDFKIEPLV